MSRPPQAKTSIAAALWWTVAFTIAGLTVAVLAGSPLTRLDRSVARSLRDSAAGGDYDWAVFITNLGA